VREILLLAVLLAVPLSTYWLVFRPQNAEINQARGEIEHKREVLEKLRSATSRNADLVRANEQISQSILAIEARLPTDKEVDGIVRRISDLAVKSGLTPPGVKSAAPVKAARYMEQPMVIQTGGEFRGFYSFLLNLERLPRITRIPDLKLTRSKKVDGTMSATFTLSIYFQDEKGGDDARTAAAGG